MLLRACATPIAHGVGSYNKTHRPRGGLLQKSDPLNVVHDFTGFVKRHKPGQADICLCRSPPCGRWFSQAMLLRVCATPIAHGVGSCNLPLLLKT